MEESAEKGIQIYSQNFGLRTAINQIPIVGSFIDKLIIDFGRDIQQRRLVELFQLLRQGMTLINESKIDKAFLESEEFVDLIIKTIENSMKTRSREKIWLNCRILTGSILTENTEIRHSSEDL